MTPQFLRFALAVLAAGLLAGACAAPGEGSGQVRSPDPAPETSAAGGGNEPGGNGTGAYDDTYNFVATTFEGERFELAAHKGTPVVINFWESW